MRTLLQPPLGHTRHVVGEHVDVCLVLPFLFFSSTLVCFVAAGGFNHVRVLNPTHTISVALITLDLCDFMLHSNGVVQIEDDTEAVVLVDGARDEVNAPRVTDVAPQLVVAIMRRRKDAQGLPGLWNVQPVYLRSCNDNHQHTPSRNEAPVAD